MSNWASLGRSGLVVAFVAVLAIPGAFIASDFYGFRLVLNTHTDYLLFLVLAPVVEELIFRGWIQPELGHRGFGPWASNGLTSVLFASAHLPLLGLNAVWWVLPSLLLGYLRISTGQVQVCMAMHAWFNAGLWLTSLYFPISSL